MVIFLYNLYIVWDPSLNRVVSNESCYKEVNVYCIAYKNVSTFIVLHSRTISSGSCAIGWWKGPTVLAAGDRGGEEGGVLVFLLLFLCCHALFPSSSSHSLSSLFFSSLSLRDDTKLMCR